MTKSPKTRPAKRIRGSREKILSVATREFSSRGLAGARVDRIAALAKTSKNMIYYHFGSKEGLYREVMRLAWISHRAAENARENDLSDPVDALAGVTKRNFDFLIENEVFVRLVMSENMNRGRSIASSSSVLKADNELAIHTLERILAAGREAGVFRDDVDPVSLHLTISALGFYYVSNRYTFGRLFDLDMTSKAAVARRRAEVVDTVLRWCARGPERCPFDELSLMPEARTRRSVKAR